MSVSDDIAFIALDKASDSNINKNLHVFSTELYIYSSTQIDSRHNLSEVGLSQNELATDCSNEKRPRKLERPIILAISNEKKLNEVFLSDFSPFERKFLKNFDFLESDAPTVNTTSLNSFSWRQ